MKAHAHDAGGCTEGAASAVGRASRVLALSLFLASLVAAVAGCRAMAAMGGLPMRGRWLLSAMWLRMCGQTWPGAAAAFLGMWEPMTVAMMLPSLWPMLARWRAGAPAVAPRRLDWLTWQVALGYLSWWGAVGSVVFVLGASLAAAALRWPSVARALPMAAAVVVLAAGLAQFTRWKARGLAGCRVAAAGVAPRGPGVAAAWRHGIRLGLHCGRCCAGPMAALLAVGLMDLAAMALATLAISAERLARDGRRMAHLGGVVGVAAGLGLAWRAWLAR